MRKAKCAHDGVFIKDTSLVLSGTTQIINSSNLIPTCKGSMVMNEKKPTRLRLLLTKTSPWSWARASNIMRCANQTKNRRVSRGGNALTASTSVMLRSNHHTRRWQSSWANCRANTSRALATDSSVMGSFMISSSTSWIH
eukprot:scaffold1511_cov170-Amphora_coffeaeformis.AAC.11